MYKFKQVVRRISANGQSIIDLSILFFSTTSGIFGSTTEDLFYDSSKTTLVSEHFNGIFYHSVLNMEFRCMDDESKPYIYKVFLRTRQSIRHTKKENFIISNDCSTAVIMTDREQGHTKFKKGKYRFVDIRSCVAMFLKYKE